MARHAEFLIGGVFYGGPCDQAVPKDVVTSPYDGRVVGTVAVSSYQDGVAAVEAAREAFDAYRSSPRRQRQALLREVARLVRQRAGELASLLVDEIGKPLTWANGEVARLALTFDLAADLLATYGGEWIPSDLDSRGDGHSLTVERFPVGPVLAIVPYNWPFNLAAHKIAPALATGNTVVVKPSRRSALSTLTLCRLIHEAGCPPGVVNAINVSGADAERLAEHEAIRAISFTGSPSVGWRLKDRFPRKRVSLELGSDSAAIVCADADLDRAIPRIAMGGYGYAGQVCIAVQRVLVVDEAYEGARTRLIAATEDCPRGDPAEAATVCGPLIDAEAADHVMALIADAEAKGGRVLAGGRRIGNLVEPTLLEDVPPEAGLATEEAFGPILVLRRVTDLDEAIRVANASRFGIHCGVFTRDLSLARRAYEGLDVSGVVIGDFPTLRFDAMPYGGVKESGFGREGLRYAMDEFTDPKALLVRHG
ncbi:MAG: aldehyde dehydrogenase family protein [Fimbriimonadaceae bacterium]|nr:aldehyde dehydrogenase family protein [Fimbriimonadaceae bacterium]